MTWSAQVGQKAGYVMTSRHESCCLYSEKFRLDQKCARGVPMCTNSLGPHMVGPLMIGPVQVLVSAEGLLLQWVDPTLSPKLH
jgi:hypothetical protein